MIPYQNILISVSEFTWKRLGPNCSIEYPSAHSPWNKGSPFTLYKVIYSLSLNEHPANEENQP